MSSAVLALALIASAPSWAADISDSSWSETAAGNNAAAPQGWTSGTMTPAQVAPTAREMMAAIKRWYNRVNPTVTSSGSANVQTLTYAVAPAAYVTGDPYRFIVGVANTGAMTLNVNSLGAKAVNLNGTALVGGELIIGRVAEVYYNGTDFQIINSPGAPSRVYVATTGSDTNSCLTVALPCATLARALTAGTALVNSNGGSLYIKMAAGSYTQSLFVNGALTGMINSVPNPNGTNVQPGQVVIEGDGSTTTTLNGGGYCATIGVSNYANVAVRAIKLLGNSFACQSTLFAQMGGMIHGLDDINFGAASIEHLHLENGGQFQGWYSYTISGGAGRHITAGQSSTYIHSAFPSGVITFVGAPTFSLQFAWATQSSTIQFNAGISFVGTFVGTRYAVTANGVITSNVSTSLTWIPGTVAGYSASGGVYQGAAPAVIAGALQVNGDGTYQHAGCDAIYDNLCGATAWTPVLEFNGVSTGITYTSSNRGRYFRFNKLIIAQADFTLTSKGAAAGAAGIAGLPFAVNSSMSAPCEVGHYAALSGISNFMGTYVNAAGTVIELRVGGATGTAPYDNTNFTNTSRIAVRCTYATD